MCDWNYYYKVCVPSVVKAKMGYLYDSDPEVLAVLRHLRKDNTGVMTGLYNLSVSMPAERVGTAIVSAISELMKVAYRFGTLNLSTFEKISMAFTTFMMVLGSGAIGTIGGAFATSGAMGVASLIIATGFWPILLATVGIILTAYATTAIQSARVAIEMQLGVLLDPLFQWVPVKYRKTIL